MKYRKDGWTLKVFDKSSVFVHRVSVIPVRGGLAMGTENRLCGNRGFAGIVREGLIVKKNDMKVIVRVQTSRCSACTGTCLTLSRSDEIEFENHSIDGELGDRVEMRIASYGLAIATGLILGIPLMLVIVSMLVSSSVVVLCVSLFVGLGISALVARTSIIERVVNFDMFVSPRIRLVDR